MSSSPSSTQTDTYASATKQQQQQETPKAPIYITMGPPCCGKTTFLRKVLQQRITKDPNANPVTDIALDDQPGVYIPVDTKYFLQNNNSTFRGSRRDDRLLKRQFYGYTFEERIYGSKNEEMRAVLQYICSDQSPYDRSKLERTIHKIYGEYALEEEQRQRKKNKNNPRARHADDDDGMITSVQDLPENHPLLVMGDDLIEAVIRFRPSTTAISQTMHVYCVEVLFRPHHKTNQTAVDMAQAKLEQYATNNPYEPLAWGNTNARPRDYRVALEVAERTGRPVYFLVSAKRDGVDNGLFLPPVSRQELLQRNLHRLCSTGKYVPVRSICDSKQRIEFFVEGVKARLKKETKRREENIWYDTGKKVNVPITKYDFDRCMTNRVNFEMDENRRVYRIAERE